MAHKFEAWCSGSSDDLMGEIVNEDNNECADATVAMLEVLLQDNNWVSDASAKVTCDGNAACCSNIIVSSTGGVSTITH